MNEGKYEAICFYDQAWDMIGEQVWDEDCPTSVSDSGWTDFQIIGVKQIIGMKVVVFEGDVITGFSFILAPNATQ